MNDENDTFLGWMPSLGIAAATTALCLFCGGGAFLPPPAFASGEIETPEYLSISEKDIQIQANKKLVDYAIGTVNTQYYDSTGGARFDPTDFYQQWKDVQNNINSGSTTTTTKPSSSSLKDLGLDTRDGTVETLKYLVSTLKDPYSKYMTREELQFELKGSHDGFLGTGAYIEVPKTPDAPSPSLSSSSTTTPASAVSERLSSSSSFKQLLSEAAVRNRNSRGAEQNNFRANIANERFQKTKTTQKLLLTNTRVANLPVVTAVAPNSPAERAGLVVGDKIVGVGDKDNFLGYGKDEIRKCLVQNWGYSDPTTKRKNELPSRYFGVADLTIAKPVYSYSYSYSSAVGVAGIDNSVGNINSKGNSNGLQSAVSSDVLPTESTSNREIVLGYRSTKVKLPTIATDPSPKAIASSSKIKTLRGDAVVQYELLSSSSVVGGGGIFEPGRISDNNDNNNNKVGYIRLTRFSKSSTEGYLNAVKTLEDEGAQSYVIDLRNNYGGVIQEAMLTASTLLGDPHAILCYLMNARGGFTPVDVESYVVDARYPGYLLSKEDKSSVLEQVVREKPNMFRTVLVGDGSKNKRLVADWDPPSSYASIHEQVAKRGIHLITYASYETLQQKMLQKEIVLLINEGTASSAEFFVATLQDNGRSLSVVGTKSFGKGIIQHTFPMPDGGGLKLTIGEFLRPSFKHVTNVFDVGFVDKASGEIVGGGGINPDVYCESRQGIPGNPAADLCVKVALDVLEEQKSSKAASVSTTVAKGLSGTNVIARGGGGSS